MAMTGGTAVLVHTGYANGNSSLPIRLYVYYKLSQNSTNKTSTITLGMYIVTPSASYNIGEWTDFNGSYIGTTSNTFNGTIPAGTKGTRWIVENKTMTVSHDADGRKTATVYWKLGVNSPWGGFEKPSGSFNITLPPFAAYSLTINAGEGSLITVNRLSCAGSGATGILANNAALWYNDVLSVSFGSQPNYTLATRTINGAAATNPSTRTVTGTINVAATATPSKSTLSVSNANIGGTSILAVTKYNPSYTHTITYTFPVGASAPYTGTICSESSLESLEWIVPENFYEKIPSSKTGICKLTIETLNGATSLGTNDYDITVTALQSNCGPVVTGKVVDTNSDTKKLTGDNTGRTLIKKRSNAECTITATPRRHATITDVKISGESISGDVSGSGVVTATKTINNVSISDFTFYAADSREYASQVSVNPLLPQEENPITVVDYVELTLNPVFSRKIPAISNKVMLSFSGNYFSGAFGNHQNAKTNTLTIRYRYKRSADSAYPDRWTEINSDNILISGCTFISRVAGSVEQGSIELDESFEYNEVFDFQIEAYDGADVDGDSIRLSTVIKTAENNPNECIVRRGIPVFDWGENDFAFHVPVTFQGKSIVDLVYPIGSIYMSVNGTEPSVLFGGEWTRIKDRFLLAAGDTYSAGAVDGKASVTLTVDEMPAHTHKILQANESTGTAGVWVDDVTTSNTRRVAWSGNDVIQNTGGGSAHDNMPPYLVVYVWTRTA